MPPGSRDHWLAIAGRVTDAVARHHTGAPNLESSAQTVSARLEVEETEALLQRVLATQRAQINDVLLTSLVRGLQDWTARDSFVVEIEGHGREDIFEGIDLSRTVGWFTTIFPVCIELEPVSKTPSPPSVPSSNSCAGFPTGASLTECCDTSVSPRCARPWGKPRQVDLIFNYLGQLDQLVAGTSLFRFAPESTGPGTLPAHPGATRWR